jgi:WD40 repeat protein
VWNLATRYVAATLTDQQSAGVGALAFSPADDDMLAVGDSNDSAYAWNEASPHQPVRPHAPEDYYGVISVAFSPSGTVLATADHNGIT